MIIGTHIQWLSLLLVFSMSLSCQDEEAPESGWAPIHLLKRLSDIPSFHVAHYQDGYTIVSQGRSGLRIFSSKVPTELVELAHIQTQGDVVRFRRFGHLGFALDRRDGVQRFDVSDMSRPQPQDFLGLRQMNDVARDVLVLAEQDEELVYIGSQFRGVSAYREREGQQVSIQLTSDLRFGLVNQLEDIGDSVIASDFYRGLVVFSKENLPDLQHRAQVDLGFRSQGFKVYGDRVWVAALDGGVIVVDITDRGAPQILHRIQTPALVHDVVVVEDRLLVAYDNLSGDYGLALFDIADLANARPIDFFKTQGVVRSLALNETVVYAADDQQGVLIFSVEGLGR